MTSAIRTAEKILAYDGDCPMCTSTVAMLIGAKCIQPQQARSIGDLAPADFATVHAAGIRNQLVVLDPETRQTRSGTDGLLWILRDNTGNHPVVRLLGLPGVRQLLRWGYEIVSYNRRVISPPRHQIVCDCEPEVTVWRRLTLIVPMLAVATLITALFGAAVFRGWDLGDAFGGAAFMEIAAGCGWVAMILASLSLSAANRLDYIAHLAVTMFIGELVLVPASALTPLVPRTGLIVLDCLSVLVSFSLMFAMQRRRVAALKLPARWLWGWVAALAIGFSVTTYLYFGRTG